MTKREFLKSLRDHLVWRLVSLGDSENVSQFVEGYLTLKSKEDMLSIFIDSMIFTDPEGEPIEKIGDLPQEAQNFVLPAMQEVLKFKKNLEALVEGL